jgi:hypothetical protein
MLSERLYRRHRRRLLQRGNRIWAQAECEPRRLYYMIYVLPGWNQPLHPPCRSAGAAARGEVRPRKLLGLRLARRREDAGNHHRAGDAGARQDGGKGT